MKTIIKYELVINEALRSALNYHTPDEQINEFIRFFGRHIGSDRIYIFEDCKERHGTDNTYEWCAEGVIPDIFRTVLSFLFLVGQYGNTIHNTPPFPFHVLSFVILIIRKPEIISIILSRNDRKWHELQLRGIVLCYTVTRAFSK